MADAGAAREQARDILAGRRFQEPDVPRPFERPLNWLGDRIGDVGRWLSGGIDDIDGALPFGSWFVWVLLGLVVAAIAWAVARSAIGRRTARAFGRDREPGVDAADPKALEAEAAAAERAGEFARAVRLRFRAGALRLEVGDGATTGEIGARVQSPVFDRLGADHDAIAYGGRVAAPPDADAAREGWPRVVREAAPR